MSPYLLKDSPASRSACALKLTHDFFQHVKDFKARAAFQDAHMLNATGYQVKIHSKGLPSVAVEARARAVGELWVNPELTRKPTQAEKILLKAIGQVNVDKNLSDVVLKFRHRIRAKLWNALKYVKENQ